MDWSDFDSSRCTVPILPDDTAESLHHRVQIQEHRIILLEVATLGA